MNKKLLSSPSYNLNNAALEGAIEDCMATKNDAKKLEILLNIFRDSQVIAPVSFPKDADRTVVMKLLSGQPIKKSENIPLFPVMVKDSEGRKYAPVFTSRDKIQEVKDFPYMVKITADQVIRNLQNEKLELEGIMINPQGKGFIIRKKAFDIDFSKQPVQQPQQEIKKVSKEEFGVLARNSVEKSVFPKRLYEEKGAFVAELEDRGTDLLCELYGKPYGDKVPNPYTADDFSLMSLNIDDETTAVCIELPARGLAPHLGMSAYVIWNPMKDEVFYYLIERGESGQANVLCNVTPDGTHQELMTAPPVGSELTAVLDLIREEKEEAGE